MGALIINRGEGHRPAQINPQDLSKLILQSEDVHAPLARAIDAAAYKTDNKESDLVTAISYFIEDNPALFKAVSIEKHIAAIIFDAYRDAFFEVLKDDKSYQEVLNSVNSSPFQRIASASQLEQAVELLVLDRLKLLHSTTPANAIENNLGLSNRVSFTGFPDSYACRECDKKAFIDFFNTTAKA